MTIPNVRRLARRDIDEQAWNAAVMDSPYGLTWWLDAVTEGHWYGLVLGDYRLVLPVALSPAPLRRVLRLVNGAAFTQHAGPFGQGTPQELALLLDAIPRAWTIRKLALYQTELTVLPRRKLSLTERSNHELNLNLPYRAIAKGYRADLRRKLRDHPPASLTGWDVSGFMAFYRQHTGSRFGMGQAEYAAQERLLLASTGHGEGQLYRLDDALGAPIAGLFIARRGQRLVNLMASSSKAGFREHGMARLLDGVIRDNAGQETLLDFEGSDLPGVATFFRGFGAVRVPYLNLADQSLVATILP